MLMWEEWRTTVWQRSLGTVVRRECAGEAGRRNDGKRASSMLNLWRKKKRRRRRRGGGGEGEEEEKKKKKKEEEEEKKKEEEEKRKKKKKEEEVGCCDPKQCCHQWFQILISLFQIQNEKFS